MAIREVAGAPIQFRNHGRVADDGGCYDVPARGTHLSALRGLSRTSCSCPIWRVEYGHQRIDGGWRGSSDAAPQPSGDGALVPPAAGNDRDKKWAFDLGGDTSCSPAWLAVTIVAAVVAGRPLEPDLAARSERYVHAIVTLCRCACRPGLRDVRILALDFLSAALVARQVWLTELWLNEQNLAMLAAITTPLVLAASFCRPLSVLQIPARGRCRVHDGHGRIRSEPRRAARALARHPRTVDNRARARRRWLIVLAVLSMLAIVWAARAGLLNRFLEIYADGRFLGMGQRSDSTSGRVASNSLWIIGSSGLAPATSSISRAVHGRR